MENALRDSQKSFSNKTKKGYFLEADAGGVYAKVSKAEFVGLSGL